MNNGASQRTRNSLRQEMKVIWMMRGKIPEMKPLALLIRRGACFIATVVTIHPAQAQETSSQNLASQPPIKRSNYNRSPTVDSIIHLVTFFRRFTWEKIHLVTMNESLVSC